MAVDVVRVTWQVAEGS
jgi:hypothetical protein